MRFGSIFFAICTVSISLSGTIGTADITPIDEFTGDVSDNFTGLVGTPIHVQTIDIFEGHVTANNLTDGGSIFVSSGSSLGGDQVNARSSPLAIAQLGVMEWEFHTPIDMFGAWFENNSRFDDATLEFYDIDDQLIGSVNAVTPEALQDWTWNGWHSDTPIHRIVSIGNDTEFLSGFIWYDDAQISFASNVPEPCGVMILGMALCVAATRRRSRT